MFYCEKCRLEKSWPDAVTTSNGQCEICGEVAICWDRPSSSLPKPNAFGYYVPPNAGVFRALPPIHEPVLGERYRHWKGDEIEVEGTAKHSETKEAHVVFWHLSERWVRPLTMWHDTEPKMNGKRRFRWIPDRVREIKELEAGRAIEMYPLGESMAPAIVEGQLVRIEPLCGVPAKLGEVVFAGIRGKNVLHRVTKLVDLRIFVRGDAEPADREVEIGVVHGRATDLAVRP